SARPSGRDARRDAPASARAPAVSVRSIAGVLTDRSGPRDIARPLPAYAGGRPVAIPPVVTIGRVPQDFALSDTLTVCGDRDYRRPPVEPVPAEGRVLRRDTTWGKQWDERRTIVDVEHEPPWVRPRGDIAHELLALFPRKGTRPEWSHRWKLAGADIDGPLLPYRRHVGEASARDRAPSFRVAD